MQLNRTRIEDRGRQKACVPFNSGRFTIIFPKLLFSIERRSYLSLKKLLLRSNLAENKELNFKQIVRFGQHSTSIWSLTTNCQKHGASCSLTEKLLTLQH